MIIFFRNISETWFVKILLAMIGVSMFGLFGLGSMTDMWGRDQTAIRVGNSSVKGQELLQSVNKEIKRITLVTGNRTALTVKEAVKNGLLDKIIKNSTDSLLYQSIMDDLELTASNDAVGNYIVNNPLFKTQTGAFDRSLMMYYLQQTQRSEQEFLTGLQEEVARKHLTDAVGVVIVPPTSLKELLFDYAFETRDIDVLVLTPDVVQIKEQPSKETLKDYYDSMEDQFYTPEYRKITVLQMTPESIASKIAVDNEQLKQMFEDRKDALSKPEKRHVEQILLTDKEQADAIFKGLTAKNFATVAKEKADQEDIDLGWVEKGEIVEEISDVVFDAPVNKVLPPVQTSLGYHILIVREVEKAQQVTFDQIKEELANAVRAEQVYDLMVEKAKLVDGYLGEGLSLSEAAKRVDLTLNDAITIDISGADKKGAAADLPVDLVQEIFASKSGEATSLHDYKKGFVVAEVQDVEESVLKPMDAVMEELKAEWVKDQQKNAIADFADKIVTGAQKDKKLETVALFYHLNKKELDDVKRSDIADMPTDEVEKMFDLKEKEIELFELPDNNYMVVQVKKIKPAEKTDVASQMSLAIELKQRLKDGIMDEILAYYRKKENVKVNQAVIDETFAPYMEEKD